MRELSIALDEYNRFDNILEIIIKTINIVIVDNPKNIEQLPSHISTIQEFYFVRGCTDLLINIFKNKDFDINRKEIHSELLYKRIFEIEKFRGTIIFFVNKLNKLDYRSLRLLRKLCVINQNPFPLVQEEIFQKLYIESKFISRFKLLSKEDNELYVEIPNFKNGGSKILLIHDIFDSENTKKQNFLLEQLTLEADL